MTQIINKLKAIFDLEERLRQIEKMDKSGLSLDDQENLINEYTKIWDQLNKVRHTA